MSRAHGNRWRWFAASAVVGAAALLAGCESMSGSSRSGGDQRYLPSSAGAGVQSNKEPKSSSGSWWTPEEQKKPPASVPQWMSDTKRMDP
jgi:hypothetical protein